MNVPLGPIQYVVQQIVSAHPFLQSSVKYMKAVAPMNVLRTCGCNMQSTSSNVLSSPQFSLQASLFTAQRLLEVSTDLRSSTQGLSTCLLELVKLAQNTLLVCPRVDVHGCGKEPIQRYQRGVPILVTLSFQGIPATGNFPLPCTPEIRTCHLRDRNTLKSKALSLQSGPGAFRLSLSFPGPTDMGPVSSQ